MESVKLYNIKTIAFLRRRDEGSDLLKITNVFKDRSIGEAQQCLIQCGLCQGPKVVGLWLSELRPLDGIREIRSRGRAALGLAGSF